ncbi:mechanosensitive ion channel family protein [Luteimonas mephitis]|uniref:mechanosensitive ion channel family protein n=1 Tax=Luteimonas mephitis TaxID=83615 RepID=UPI0004229699|nr:mechanosensitive ion channel family protein [Luteimonas mephitis]
MQDFIESNLVRPLAGVPFASTLAGLLALALIAWIANWLTRRVLLAVVGRLAKASPSKWDDAIMGRRVLARLANVVPALVVLGGIALVPEVPEWLDVVVRNVALAYVALTVAMAIGNLLNALNDIYEQTSRHAVRRPIKGYLQLLKIAIYVIAGVLIIASLIGRSPLVLLTGLGAMTAVLMLVFKDTILSLVASVQLSSNDMLRVGDWIEMPSQNADGDVIDISLHTVKVQNWDKTISTIPTWKLINESYRNWRGMSEFGGRRIKRALLIDQTSVRFLRPDEREHLRRIALIDEYLDKQKTELAEYNAKLEAAGKDPVNNRRATNLGTFRAYMTAYLRSHPGVAHDMTLMVRQLDPTPTGLPLQVYCFSADVRWVPYENLAGDIFDHLLAVLPEFGLRIFQQPSGAELSTALAGLRAAPVAAEE